MTERDIIRLLPRSLGLTMLIEALKPHKYDLPDGVTSYEWSIPHYEISITYTKGHRKAVFQATHIP